VGEPLDVSLNFTVRGPVPEVTSVEKLATGAIAVTGGMKIRLKIMRKMIAQVAGFAIYPLLIFTPSRRKKTVLGNFAEE
jgi:hypothetical protein